MIILALISTVLAYGNNNCRKFGPDQLVPNFNMTLFFGNWFPQWTSVGSPYIWGKCPLMYFGPIEAQTNFQKRREKKLNGNFDRF